MKSIILVSALIGVTGISATAFAEPDLMVCNYSLSAWQQRNDIYASSFLSYMSKPLTVDSLDGAIVMKAGKNCDACSGIDSAAVVVESGVYALPYSDELRANMPKGTDYIHAKIENTEVKDLYVSFQDDQLMSAARAKANFNSEGVVVFWPQVNRNWRHNVLLVDSRQNYQPIEAKNLNGTPEAAIVKGRVAALLKKRIADLEKVISYDYRKKQKSVDDIVSFVSNQYPEELRLEQKQVANSQSALVTAQREYSELTEEMKSAHNAVVTRTLQSQAIELQKQISDLTTKLSGATLQLESSEKYKVQADHNLAGFTAERDTEKKKLDEILADFHANGLAGCGN